MPDKNFVAFILCGIKSGFRIGFDRPVRTLKATSNTKSAVNHPQPAQAFISKELQAGRIVGPLDPSQFPHIYTSRFGVIPKRSQPGKWRLILDLSFPEHNSVNEGINVSHCSMKYTSVDEAACIIAKLGRDSLLAKIDIAHAYRNVPVHPDDRHLLGMLWDGSLYVDTVLPFGLRSAPKIFSAISDSLERILR